MTKEIFENRYNRKSYLDFFRYKLLPDDFETCIEKVELSRSYRFIKEMFIIGECKSLDLLVIESSILSIMNPRSMPVKEILIIIKKYLFANLIIITVPTKKRHYRMSLITSELHLNSNKVKQINEITKTKSLYLGTKFRRLDRKDFYVPLLRKSNIKTIEDLNTWFLKSHELTFFQPSRKKNRLWEAYLEYERKEKHDKYLENLSYMLNPFKSRYECFDSELLDAFETYDKEFIFENFMLNSEEFYIQSAYKGFENSNSGFYSEAIVNFNEALFYDTNEAALILSTLAKCYYFELDYDNFLHCIVTVVDIDNSYIDDEHRSFFHALFEELKQEELI